MERAIPSLEFLPARRTITGTCPLKSRVNKVDVFGGIEESRVTSKIVPDTSLFIFFPFCFRLKTFRNPASLGDRESMSTLNL